MIAARSWTRGEAVRAVMALEHWRFSNARPTASAPTPPAIGPSLGSWSSRAVANGAHGCRLGGFCQLESVEGPSTG